MAEVSIASLPSITRKILEQTTAANTAYDYPKKTWRWKNSTETISHPRSFLSSPSSHSLDGQTLHASQAAKAWFGSVFEGHLLLILPSGRRVSVGGLHLLGRRFLDADRRLLLPLQYGIVLILHRVVHDGTLAEINQHPCNKDKYFRANVRCRQ